MKFVKGISLFFVYPAGLLLIGFCLGVNYRQEGIERFDADRFDDTTQSRLQEKVQENSTDNRMDFEKQGMEIAEAGMNYETLCVDTRFILEETDILSGTIIETVTRLPQKYIGMNREQFLEAMAVYEAFPPLAEMERGFVGLEVLTFSREKVTVQMNYKYIQSDGSFYLMAYNNEVYVYLDDRKTVYIETGIMLKNLPEKLQQEIVKALYIENEDELYQFLETYSS